LWAFHTIQPSSSIVCIGNDAYNVFTTMELSTAVAPLDAYEAHCVAQVNETYERYLFNRRQQEAPETFDAFLGDLRRLVKTCGYGTAEESITHP